MDIVFEDVRTKKPK